MVDIWLIPGWSSEVDNFEGDMFLGYSETQPHCNAQQQAETRLDNSLTSDVRTDYKFRGRVCDR